jgi:hypothetical protein
MKILAEKECGSNVWASSTISLKLVALVAFWCVPVCTLAQEQRVSQYAHRAWLVRDGSFGGAPDAITQTTDGYIWVGTGSGIFRFDGARFEPWSSPDGKQFSPRQISALLGARVGSLWIGMGEAWHISLMASSLSTPIFMTMWALAACSRIGPATSGLDAVKLAVPYELPFARRCRS